MTERPVVGKIRRMTDKRRKQVPDRYRAEFTLRTQMARKAAGLTQEEMARRLGLVPADSEGPAREFYAKYESRTCLPHHLVVPFCQETGADIVWYLSGKKPRGGHVAGPEVRQSRPTARARS